MFYLTANNNGKQNHDKAGVNPRKSTDKTNKGVVKRFIQNDIKNVSYHQKSIP